MKSIKEKSDEYLQQEKDEIVSVYDRYAGFVDGAIYVLDAIQSCIDRHEDGCLALEAIILTIDELKNK